MGSLKANLNACLAAEAAVTLAFAARQNSVSELWAALAPALVRHEKGVKPLFEEAGFADLYRERFGSADGNRLISSDVQERSVEFTIGYSFHGELVENQFRLPKAYLNNDLETQLTADVARFKKVFERLARRREARKAAETRQANLREFARLKELLKDDPEASRG